MNVPGSAVLVDCWYSLAVVMRVVLMTTRTVTWSRSGWKQGLLLIGFYHIAYTLERVLAKN